MSGYQWAMLVVAVAGFVLTGGSVVVAITRAVGKITLDTTEKISAIEKKLLAEFVAEQKVQDHNFGEVGAALRQYIANVEKEMHQIEMWGRDHYALKDDVDKATDSIREDIRDLTASIKADFRDLSKKIDAKMA